VNPEQMVEIIGGEITAHFMSEFHTDILEGLEQFMPDWVKRVVVPNVPHRAILLGKQYARSTATMAKTRTSY
jgi:hypothetical protein